MFSLENDDVSVIREVAQKSKSRICGFILYTRADAHIKKVIKDEDYWDALDAASGVKAAKAAGMQCIAVRNPNSGQQDLSLADRIINKYEEISI